jgi:hypothetical protein
MKSKIEFNIEEEKKMYLQNIIKELYSEKAIISDNINDFLDFTLFIVFDEYIRNKNSLSEFYRRNLFNYLESKRQKDIR